MPSNLLCAMAEQGAHSLAEGPGLGCNLLHYPPPPSTPVPCPELTLPVLLLLCSALWSFKEGRKGHLLSLFAQPRHKTWQRLVTHSRLLSLFSRVRSEDVPPNPGVEAEELRAWARRCPQGATASSVLPPPHSLHLAASREVGLRVPGVLSLRGHLYSRWPCSSHHVRGREEAECRVSDLEKTGELWSFAQLSPEHKGFT